MVRRGHREEGSGPGEGEVQQKREGGTQKTQRTQAHYRQSPSGPRGLNDCHRGIAYPTLPYCATSAHRSLHLELIPKSTNSLGIIVPHGMNQQKEAKNDRNPRFYE